MKFKEYLLLLENKTNNTEILAPFYKYGEYYLKDIDDYKYWSYLIDRLSNYYKLFYKTTEDNNNKDYFDKATQSLGFNVENASQIKKPLDEIGEFVNTQNGTKNIDFKSDFEKNEHRFEIIEKYNKFVESFYPEVEEKLKKTNFYIFNDKSPILAQALYNNDDTNDINYNKMTLLAYSPYELFLKNNGKKCLLMKYAKNYNIPPTNQTNFYLKGKYIFQYVENLKPSLEPFKYKYTATMEYSWNPTIDDIYCTNIYNIDENFYNEKRNKNFINAYFNSENLKTYLKTWLEIK